MKATLLINSSLMAFYLLAFDIRHLCKGYGRMQLRPLSLHGPPSDCLLLLKGGHPSENIDHWTVSPCICIRKVALARNCICCLLLSRNGETGDLQSRGSGQALQEVWDTEKYTWLERGLREIQDPNAGPEHWTAGGNAPKAVSGYHFRFFIVDF